MFEPTSGRSSLDRYELLELVSSGGMGKVYKARLRGPHQYARVVALKVIHDHLVKDERFVRMFLDEVSIASRLTHPNICSVLDFGVANGTYYYVMEFLRGVSVGELAERIRKSGPPDTSIKWSRAVARIGADICAGLHAAHELRGEGGRPLEVVHRDVSPANLMVCFDGSVRVLDFGLASANQRLASSEVGELKGQCGYIAPEILENQTFDRRADVWGLGVVLWELLAGRTLFVHDAAAATMRAVLSLPIPAVYPQAPADAPIRQLEAIVRKALERNPGARYPNAAAFGRALNQWLASQDLSMTSTDIADMIGPLYPGSRVPTSTLPPLTPPSSLDGVARLPPAPGESRRRPARLGMVLAVCACALVFGAGAGWLFHSWREAEALPSGFVVSSLPVAADTSREARAAGTAPREQLEPPSSPSRPQPPAPVPPPRSSVDLPAVEIRAETPPAAEESSGSERRPDQPPPLETESRGGSGLLALTTYPCWAETFIDGRRRGPTPLRIRLPTGRHRLRLVPGGNGHPTRGWVEIRAGRATRRSVRLTCPN